MGEYRITFAESARREVEKLDRQVARRIWRAIEKLAAVPRPNGCVKLTGTRNDWRIRIGDWRVLYTIYDDDKIVDIAAIGHRSDAYR